MMAKQRPFAGIAHDVIDSAAFADLNGEAVRLLLIVARQSNGLNNGRLHASHSYCRSRGISSESTLQRAVSSLIAHGFIYRTRSHGIDPITSKNIPAMYACTWLPLTKNRKGLFCDGFVHNAFEKWAAHGNLGVSKVKDTPPENCSFSRGTDAKKVPVKTVVSATGKPTRETVKTVAYEQVPVYVPAASGNRPDCTTAPLIRRGRHAQLLSVRSHLKTSH